MEVSPTIEAPNSAKVVKSEQLLTKSRKTMTRKRFAEYASYHGSSCHSVKPGAMKEIKENKKLTEPELVYETPTKISRFEVEPQPMIPTFYRRQSQQKMEVCETLEDEQCEIESCSIDQMTTPIHYLRSQTEYDDQPVQQVPRIGTRKPLGEIFYIETAPRNSRLNVETFYTISALKEAMSEERGVWENIQIYKS